MCFTELHPLASEPNETSREVCFFLGAGTCRGLHLRGAAAGGWTSPALRDRARSPPLPTEPRAASCRAAGRSLPGALAAGGAASAAAAAGGGGGGRGGGGGGGRKAAAGPSRRAEAQAEGAFAMRGRRRRAAPGAAHPPAAPPLTGQRTARRSGTLGTETPAQPAPRDLPGGNRALGPALLLPGSLPPSLPFPPPPPLCAFHLPCS